MSISIILRIPLFPKLQRVAHGAEVVGYPIDVNMIAFWGTYLLLWFTPFDSRTKPLAYFRGSRQRDHVTSKQFCQFYRMIAERNMSDNTASNVDFICGSHCESVQRKNCHRPLTKHQKRCAASPFDRSMLLLSFSQILRPSFPSFLLWY